MSPRLSDTARAEIGALTERQLSVEEVRAYLSTPVTDEEREEILQLARWFQRRYPTGAERLAYVRRAYARWARLAARTVRI